MLEGQYETDPWLERTPPEGTYTGRRKPPPASKEELVAEIWERKQGAVLGDRKPEFLRRTELQQLVRFGSYHLEEGARFAMQHNSSHHLLLVEWVVEVEGIIRAESRARSRPSASPSM